jgi:predicted short-subunit dehydrogenase-like oxidoreductase (DUF2520 family)
MQRAGVTLSGILVRSRLGAARARAALPGVPTISEGREIPSAHGVLLAVPDRAISDCAAQLVTRFTTAPAVALHTSGLLPAAALDPLRPLGCRLGSFHPLMTFARATGPLVELHGVLAALEGDAEAVREAKGLARRLGLRPIVLSPRDKPRYHAAAALAANLCHVLMAEARSQLEASGLTRRQATTALRPLLEATVAGVLASNDLERLTGPLVRGDTATVMAHLGALAPEVGAAYRAVAALAVARLQASGSLSEQAARALDEALTSPAHCGSVTKMRQSGGV